MTFHQVSFDLKVVSFVHIGSGDEIQPPEMFLQQNRFHRINMGALFQDSQFDIDNYLTQLDSTDVRQIQLSDIDSSTPLNYILYSMALGSKVNINKPCPVREMIKTGRSQAYIPGSSIKGAIRTAVFWKKLSSLCQKNPQFKDFMVAVLRKEDDTIEQFVNRPPFNDFGVRINMRRRNAGQRLFELLSCIVTDEVGKHPVRYRGKDARFLRWLEVSDTHPMSITPKNSMILKIETKNASRPIPLRFEVVRNGTVLPFTIASHHLEMSLSTLMNTCDDFYNRVIDAEKEWFDEQGLDSSFYARLKNNKWKIRLGQGSGSWTTSLLILADKLGIQDEYISNWRITKYRIKPKTRKLIQDNKGNIYPLGWVLIKPQKESSLNA